MPGDKQVEAEWVRWLISAVVGVVTFAVGWIVYELRDIRKQLAEVREHGDTKLEAAERRWGEEMDKRDEITRRQIENSSNRLQEMLLRFEQKQDDFAKEMSEDRKQASADRVNIAGMVLTKAEFDRQMDRRFPERGRAAAE